jgi:cell division protein FtsW (lipid II flippase)
MTCFQAFVNISTSIDLFVPTGMPLPFVSYGGSSLLSYAIIFGTVANFTRHEKSSFNQSS